MVDCLKGCEMVETEVSFVMSLRGRVCGKMLVRMVSRPKSYLPAKADRELVL
jgi:hypothetical protein